MVHAAGDDFDGIGDDLARHEGIAHALVSHHDAVGGGGSAEGLADAAAGANAFERFLRQPIEMSVARGDVGMEVGDANHGPIEIVVHKADCPQHGPVGRAANAFGGRQTAATFFRHEKTP